MNKIKAIISILFADKWAVFTYNEAPEDPVWATFPVFQWNISEKCDYFFRLIKDRLRNIENYDSALIHEQKIYKDEET